MAPFSINIIKVAFDPSSSNQALCRPHARSACCPLPSHSGCCRHRFVITPSWHLSMCRYKRPSPSEWCRYHNRHRHVSEPNDVVASLIPSGVVYGNPRRRPTHPLRTWDWQARQKLFSIDSSPSRNYFPICRVRALSVIVKCRTVSLVVSVRVATALPIRWGIFFALAKISCSARGYSFLIKGIRRHNSFDLTSEPSSIERNGSSATASRPLDMTLIGVRVCP